MIENKNSGVPIIWWAKTLSSMSLAATVLNVVVAVVLPPPDKCERHRPTGCSG
jgi:hypothetical protein